jgi:amino acid adenylation domain-containing protein
MRRIAELSPAKRALLAVRSPLSFGQERLWFLEQLEGGNPAYHLGTALRLEGELDVAALRRSLTEIVRRHEVLRTTFAAPDGDALQVVHPAAETPLPVLDLQGLPAGRREEEIRRRLTAEARRPFDLQAGPLLRCRLARLDGGVWIFALVVHHIVFDGWSTDLLVRELVILYEAFAAGRPSPLPELPVQYLDFARWQREVLKGERLDRLLSVWKRRLEGAPQVLELPLDRPRPKVRSGRGCHRARVFSPAANDALRELARRGGTTLFTAALAFFLAFLSRISGQRDVVAGFPVANRTRPELEPLIGFFVNTLVVRAYAAGEIPVAEHLAQVREAVVDAQDHQDLPFEKLVKELHPERDLAHTPLFQVLFAFLPRLQRIREIHGLAISPVDLDTAAAQFDLTLAMGEGEYGLGVRLDFATDVLDGVSAERLLDQLDRFLAAAAHGLRLGDLPLLGEAARHHLLAEWNDAVASSPGHCLHELVATQARRTPGAVAVSAEGVDLTYRELMRLAGRVAARLCALSVEPEERVGVCTRRSTGLVAGLLGVLQAGGAYVPLDPDFPPARLDMMMEDSGARVVLADRVSLGALGEHAAQVVLLDGLEEHGSDGEAHAGPAVLPDNLAYVIFTSGSSGRPKGVQVTHRALVNFLASMAVQPGLAAGETLLAVTTLSFDIAALELFLPLIRGGRVVLVSREAAGDGVRLTAELEGSGPVVMQATPATWRLLFESGWQGAPRLRALCGGEAFPRDLAERLCARMAAVWNLYGPTETTVWSAVHEVEERPGPVPIGRPVANTEIHLVDRQGAPAPIGVCGELLIGGTGVARGYLGRPDLTAGRFVPDPFSGRPGARLYCTGDLARRLANGTVEFLGRADQQVKVRGFRIELEEIETVLRSHPAVRQAVVDVRGGGEDRMLVAYVVPEGDPADPAVMRSFLALRLPGYMVPWVFVWLDELPLTPNGKVDRRALPAPGGSDPAQPVFVPPGTPIEQKLAELWREVLRRERVGVHDHFFELGGDSILSMRLVIKARQAGIGITPRQIFQYPTLGGLAMSVAGGPAAGEVPAAEPAPGLADAVLSEAELAAVLAQIEPAHESSQR